MESEDANVIGNIPPKYEAAQRCSKHSIALALLAATAAVSLPGLVLRTFWMEDGRSKNDFVVAVLLPVIQLYLTLLCPALLTNTKPQLGRFDRQWFRWTRSELTGVPLLLLGALLVNVVCAALVSLGVLPPERPGVPFVPAGSVDAIPVTWLIVWVAILSPLAEEIFWRGYVQSTMAILMGDRVAIFTQALLFGFLHFTDTSTIVHASLMGLVLGIWCSKRRTLLPAIVVHSLQNATVLVLGVWR